MTKTHTHLPYPRREVTHTILESIRNSITGIIGAYLTFSISRFAYMMFTVHKVTVSPDIIAQAFFLDQIQALNQVQWFVLPVLVSGSVLMLAVYIIITIDLEREKRFKKEEAQQMRKDEIKAKLQAEEDQHLIKEMLTVIKEANTNGLASKEAARQRLSAAQGSLGNTHLVRYLQWRYPQEPLYKRGNEVYPIRVFAAPQQQVNDIESVLKKPISKRFVPSPFTVADTHFRELIATANRPAWNGDTFVLNSFNTGETGEAATMLSIESALGHYYDMIDTCDDLEWETLSLHKQLTSDDEHALLQFDELMLLRRQLQDMGIDPIRNGHGRSVALSLSCTIVYRENDQYKLLIRKRSRAVAVHPGLIHVVPSFMFQPMSAAFDDEYSIQHNIFREYREELFNRPDPKGGVIDWRYFYDDPLIIELQRYLADGDATFFFTGVSVNMLSFRPEMHTVLLIDTDEWQGKHIYAKRGRITFCDEFTNDNIRQAEELMSNDADDVPRVEPIVFQPGESDEQLLARLDNLITAKNLVPCAAAAIWLTIDLLNQRASAGGLAALPSSSKHS